MTKCDAVANLFGRHVECEVEAPHPGLAHSNKKAQLLWVGSGEITPEEEPGDPQLGLATTAQLLEELTARAVVGGYAGYRTVDGG